MAYSEAEYQQLLDNVNKRKIVAVEQVKSKFKNKKTFVGGFKFDSKKEAERYNKLKLMELGGDISDIQLQVSFPFVVNDVKICTYIADFVYMKNGVKIVEDVKSAHTRTLPVYRIKNKLMKALYSIEINEI